MARCRRPRPRGPSPGRDLQIAAVMRKRTTQLKLPMPPPTAADRRAFIRDRLKGYAYRQAAREQKRKQAAEKRKQREPDSEPEQLAFSGPPEGSEALVE